MCEDFLVSCYSRMKLSHPLTLTGLESAASVGLTRINNLFYAGLNYSVIIDLGAESTAMLGSGSLTL